MVYFARWKIILVLLVCVWGVIYAAPNAVPEDTVAGWQEEVPGWLPVRQINLGLDLQGGAQILLRVEYTTLIGERLEAIVSGLRRGLVDAQIRYVDLGVEGDAATFRLLDPDANLAAARNIAAELEEGTTITSGDDGTVSVRFDEAAIEVLRADAVTRSIEIVRRRIDELGTTEPVIQRQGGDRILVQVPGVDDPERIKELLGQTAKLTFQMVDHDTPVGEAEAGRLPPGSILLPDAQVGPTGEPVARYVVRRQIGVAGDSLIDAQATFQDGVPVVSFRFDGLGARQFADITTANVNRSFAIVLDDAVISAPRIRTPITGGRGIIEGGFTVQSATDLALLLRAGALPAPLTVMEERSVGPGLGADSIAAGEIAAVIGFAAVVVFMALTYGLFGLMANVALIINLTIILAALSALQATLTLPGIAGIVLTVGMAVDANVLIFERIREEIRNGRSPISAIDAGYSRALTTIVDSNLTTLIAAVLLFAMGSGPVRGFAVTLSLGILSSMFTAIMVTRLMVVTWLRRTRPTVIPI